MPANVDFSTNYTFAQANDYCRQLDQGRASLFDPTVCGSNLQAILKDIFDVAVHSPSMRRTTKNATGVLCHFIASKCLSDRATTPHSLC